MNQSYFGEFPDFKNVISPIGNVPIRITSITHFHVIIFILCFLLLIIQPILVIKKKIAWHRILGKGSYVVASILVTFININGQSAWWQSFAGWLATNFF